MYKFNSIFIKFSSGKNEIVSNKKKELSRGFYFYSTSGIGEPKPLWGELFI